MKKIIGIFPTVKIDEESHLYRKCYEFIIHYSHKIYDAKAIPIGLVLDNGHINEEQLSLCDAFLLPGGHRIDNSVFELLLYAYKNHIPVLGICMGMQELSIFSVILDELKQEELTITNILNKYESLKNNPVITKIKTGVSHDVPLATEPLSKAFHKINLSQDNCLYDLYKTSEIEVVCLHNYEANRVGSLFKVIATSFDGVIEAIESTDKTLFWLGTQFHPEANPQDKIIKWFIDTLGQ